jgi:hypothetical protein
MAFRTAYAVCSLTLLTLGACQTTPQADAGFMSGYDRLEPRKKTLRAAVRERRDEAATRAIERIFIEPSAVVGGAGAALAESDRRAVLREVDRQVCYELSERFTVLGAPDPQAATVRVGVTRIAPTGRFAAAASAAANYFIPGPLGVRAPGTTGGLAAEAELLAPGGVQVAAMAWARDAQVVGTDDPSLSRVGDALQLAEPFGDAVGEAFAPADRKSRKIAKPDPCMAFGPRTNPGGFVAGAVTGLYVPELSGAGPAKAEPAR